VERRQSFLRGPRLAAITFLAAAALLVGFGLRKALERPRAHFAVSGGLSRPTVAGGMPLLGNLPMRTFSATAEPSADASETSEVKVVVPYPWKIVTGGAKCTGGITASYPVSLTTWIAGGTRCGPSDGASPVEPIEARVTAVFDPDDEWEGRIATSTASGRGHIEQSATLPEGYVLTGGGFATGATGPACFLGASSPLPPRGWTVSCDLSESEAPATATAYAIGFRPRHE
jgi:hypothetical protein